MSVFKRPSNTLADGKGYGRGRLAPMINLGAGGHGGHLPDWPSYLTNTPYVRRNLIIKVLAGPRGFKYLPEPERWYQALKSVIEILPESVEGFNAGYTVDVRDASFHAAGERQEAVSDVTIARTEPVFNYVEKYGLPLTYFFQRWVSELLMDPNTKYPNVVNRVNRRVDKIDLLPDFTSATIIAFEPDPSFTKVSKAWLVVDVKPKGTLAPIEGKRDIHNGGDLNEFSINMTGMAQYGYPVELVAQKLLDEMIDLNVNVYGLPAVTDGVDGDIVGVRPGFTEQLEDAARTQMTGL